MLRLARQFTAIAEKQSATAPQLIGHRMMGISLTSTGNMVGGRDHFDRALALYDPEEQRPLATRFSIDSRVSVLGFRSAASWFLAYPEAALVGIERALKDAREIGQAATWMYILNWAGVTEMLCGNYAHAGALSDELVGLAGQKGTPFWKAMGMILVGCVSAQTDRAADAVRVITSGLTTYRSINQTLFVPFYSSCLARAHAELSQFDDARRCIGEAMTKLETTKERWCEAEVYRTAGEIVLLVPERDAAKAEAYFDHALTVARGQEAKSWELRAAMSMARLWRDQGKPRQARELLSPVYKWFTEGFGTRDLKDAKALLEQLAS